MSLTAERLRQLLDYDPESGAFTWRERPRSDFATENSWAVWNSKHAGTIAGGRRPNGYWYIRVAGKMRKASRLAWAYVNGAWPDRIDHISGDSTDDRIANLRDVSQAQNSRNRAIGATNTSGVLGVYSGVNGTWHAQLDIDKRRVYLGTFPSIAAAAAERRAAERQYGFHPNHGRPGAARRKLTPED
jgi:hypothetical protein